MNAQAAHDLEYFYAGGHFALTLLLSDAAKDKDARAAVAQIGAELQADGLYRMELKNGRGWEGFDSAWAALNAFIKANRTDDAWWHVLEFADGTDVSEEVHRFFISTNPPPEFP